MAMHHSSSINCFPAFAVLLSLHFVTSFDVILVLVYVVVPDSPGQNELTVLIKSLGLPRFMCKCQC